MNFTKNMRKVVSAFLVLLTISAFIIAPVTAVDEPGDFGQYYGIVKATSLNVRASASTDAEIVATLSSGACATVNWMEPGWVCIAYNGDGLMGYVSDEYFEIHQGEMPKVNTTAGQAAVEIAKKYLGVPYVYGGSSPRGFDCSGLMQYVYSQLGYSINRVAASQMSNGISISKSEMVPGDIIGFYSSPGGGYVNHVGMYIGDGKMIHAPHTGDVVRIADIGEGTYYNQRFAGARRIIY